jgi:hypothetical protein
MKKIYVHLFTFIILVLLLSTQGCGSKNIQTVTTTEPAANAIYTAGAATLFAQETEAAKSYPPRTPTQSSTLTPTPVYVPKWEISTSGSNFALIVLDYETLKYKAAYFEIFKPCELYENLKSDQDLIAQAENVLMRTGPRPSLQHVGDFALFEIYPGDIGGAAILDPCTGQVLFVGSIAWLGGGGQIYPVHPIEPDAFENENGPIMQPQRIDAISSPESTNVEGFETAWNSVQSFNLVHDFASYQYSVFVYLYAPSVGAFYPPDAEWLIFLHRGPSQ